MDTSSAVAHLSTATELYSLGGRCRPLRLESRTVKTSQVDIPEAGPMRPAIFEALKGRQALTTTLPTVCSHCNPFSCMPQLSTT